MSATLLVIQGRNQGDRIEVGDASLDLGRGAASGYRVLDTEVSRVHATVRPTEVGGYELVDRSSSNGSFVNGKVVDRIRLRNGDHIQLGRTVLLFETADQDDTMAWEVAAAQVDLAGGDIGAESIVAQVNAEASRGMLSHVRSGSATTAALRTNLEVLYEVSELVVRPSVGIDELLEQILSLTLDAIGADRGVMLIADPQTDEIKPRVFGGRKAATDQGRMPISRTIVDYVLTRGRGVQTSDAAGDERFEGHESILRSGIREALCVPMQGRFELLGVIYVDTTQAPGESMLQGSVGGAQRFNDESLMLLAAVGRQAALAVENHRYQDALVKAERLAAVGQTVAMLSHHVKNILQGMRGGGYLIEQGLSKKKDEMALRGWNILDRNQERLYNLVMDMLAFSKDRTPNLESVSLNEVVVDVAELMQPAAAEQDIRIRTELSDEMMIAQADPEGLHRAVLNLVVNAIEAMDDRDDGEIQLRTRRGDLETLAIEVADNGPGIPADQLGRLFTLFESSKGSRGTGIGLAVSQKILHEHGGEIQVHSQPGQGTTFRLLLPQRDDRSNLKATGEFDALP